VCRVLDADRGNYHGWVRALAKRRDRDREHTDQQLIELILEVHTAYPAYAVPRVTHELERQGIAVGWRVVTRLMRANGITGTSNFAAGS
jgi:HTH-like domain